MTTQVGCRDCGATWAGGKRDAEAWARGHYCDQRAARELAGGRPRRTVQLERARANRTARLNADPTVAPHGNVTTYREWGCRCVPCTSAYTRMSVEAARRRLALRRRQGGTP